MRRLALTVLFGALTLASCGGPVYVRDTRCLSYCEGDNDRCLIQATTAGAVQMCDQRMTACVHHCGR